MKHVAGFNGIPMKGGTGWKGALVFNDETGLFNQDVSREFWYREDIEVADEGGLLCLFPDGPRYPFEPRNKIVVYAHDDFIRLLPGSTPPEYPATASWTAFPERECVVGYMPKQDAFAMWREWAVRLREGAELLIGKKEAGLALKMAWAARYCVVAPELHDEQLRVFSAQYAAFQIGGRDVGSLRYDFGLCGPPEEWEVVEKRGRELLGI